jgi:RNA polymerase sigma-70 factor (ECF subfamily)
MSFDEAFDEILVASRDDGAAWALTALYRDLHPPILRYLRAMEPGEADDLAADTWVDIIGGLHRFQGDETGFRAWAFTIARRRVVDLRRTRSRRRTTPTSPETLVALGATGDVESEAMDSLETEAALSRIASLPPDQAEVVLLRVVAGLPTDQVAAITGKRPGAIRAIQHRALRRLAREISREAVTP